MWFIIVCTNISKKVDMKGKTMIKYKKISKKVIKDIEILENKLNSKKYYYLSKILKSKNLKDFLYNFMKIYDSMPNIKDYHYQYFENSCYKFIYFEDINQRMYKSKDVISKKINILAVLGLIKKLDIYNEKVISSSIIKKTINKSKKENKRCVNYYNIPNYTNKLLKEANEVAKILIENKMTIKNFNKAFIINVFGQEFANKIFLDKRKIPKEYEQLRNEIRKKITFRIKLDGIIKQNELFDYICNDNNKFSQSVIKNNTNIILNKMVNEKLIIKRRLNQKEKAQYKIPKNNKYIYILKGDKWNGK